ncbi:probable UDP-glucosyl transferase 73B6 [Ziziphus jujuba]|uniref:Probable UDP-glucosyl transferase 73B6 n=1 Tax=Ziziphus jujuba TaxID=326968 RepID=A0ABM4A8N8_ZIZJJ|nr:probable UDP-glucosyl transferase 73B6 [Ziziphus jujuba]
MTKLGDQPACVISDSFLGWTNASCRRFGIPRLTFHGMGAFAMAVKKSLSIYQTHREGVDSDSTIRNVEGVQLPFVLTTSDLPNSLRETNGEISRFFLDAEISDLGSWGVIANTIYELEKDHVGSLLSLYDNQTMAFCIGPLFLLHGQILKEPNPFPTWANWLNQQVIWFSG